MQTSHTLSIILLTHMNVEKYKYINIKITQNSIGSASGRREGTILFLPL